MAQAVTSSKFEGFDRIYGGQGPHYEVWYGKVDVPGDRALWFRYKTLDGVVKEASAWAVWFDADGVRGGKKCFPLEDVRPQGFVTREGFLEEALGSPLRFEARQGVFRVGDAHLDDGNALGRAGAIQWDLQWNDSGRRFRYIPHELSRMGVARSTYDACFLDLRVTGQVLCDGIVVEFEDAPGMVGHIEGKRIAGHSWAWSHCNNFDDEGEQVDAVFEGLTARALVAGRGSPLMTALVLYLGKRRYAFHGPLQIFRTRSAFDRSSWTFSAHCGGVELHGKIRAPEQVALVRYIDTDGSLLYCFNSKLASLELRLVDREAGIERRLRSRNRAAFETLTRDRPREIPLI